MQYMSVKKIKEKKEKIKKKKIQQKINLQKKLKITIFLFLHPPVKLDMGKHKS